nr:hypothetical protein [Rhodococcus sp. (in: high G+C Gram-positive bacteria)]
MSVKIAGLTGSQIDALEEAVQDGLVPESLTYTATTATYASGDGKEAARLVAEAREKLATKHGRRRGHPVQSLAAVIRKFHAADA